MPKQGGLPRNEWRKSSKSVTDNCVEASDRGDQVWVRDSKDPLGPLLKFPHDSWAVFLDGMTGAGQGA